MQLKVGNRRLAGRVRKAGSLSAQFPVVTGAGSGIGQATALRLHEEGAPVIATDVVPQRLEELGREHPSDLLVTVAGAGFVATTIEAPSGSADAAERAGPSRTLPSQCHLQNVAWMQGFANVLHMDTDGRRGPRAKAQDG